MVSNNTAESLSVPDTINASPTKRFFVEMLTRDIELEDAILDLLDNCVDGIQRSLKDSQSSDNSYKNFWAKISFSAQGFKIEDNCGGIPIDVAKRYAFRMGRPVNAVDNDIYTIGTYGIGMKRAIFKIGRSSQIISKTKTDYFKVTINSEWLNNDSNWELPFEELDRPVVNDKDNGTIIEVTDLREGILQEFSSPQSTLHNSLVGKISNYYSYILNKGFTVWVNQVKVPIIPIKLLWDGAEKIGNQAQDTIAPFLYEAEKDGVEIKLAVGFYRPIAGEEEVEDEMQGNRGSSDTAGWTIVCNDRVVVYCDKTRLTGWGEATVPSYHPQFIAISGVVYFRSKDASNLPITTTKRGIDASADIYLYVKDFMREGLKLFTSYTNKWKKNIPEEKKRISQAKSIDPNEIFKRIPEQDWTQVRKKSNGDITTARKYVPTLPKPEGNNGGVKKKNISFSRSVEEIQLVADYLFEDSEREPSEVGNECFENFLIKAKE